MKKIFLVMLFIVCFSFSAYAAVGTATLMWDCTATRTDNSVFNCVTEPKTYTIYYGVTSPPTTKLTIPISTTFPALITNMVYTINNLIPGQQYFFDVTVTDQYGQESNASNVIVKSSPLPAPPGAPKLNSVILAFVGLVLAVILKLVGLV
jgi:hypothetical protein